MYRIVIIIIIIICNPTSHARHCQINLVNMSGKFETELYTK